MPQSRGMETDDALRAYYERGMERERLSDGRGDLEFTAAISRWAARIDGMLRERRSSSATWTRG
jgi:hypothetical protein